MNTNTNTARKLYDDMMDSYWQFAKNGEDSDSCYRRFLLAAIALVKLNEPNPFCNHDDFTANAAVKPSCEHRVITAVAE